MWPVSLWGRSRSADTASLKSDSVNGSSQRLASPSNVSNASSSVSRVSTRRREREDDARLSAERFWWLEAAERQVKELELFFGLELEKASARHKAAIAACQDRFDALLAQEREERIRGLAALGRELGDPQAAAGDRQQAREDSTPAPAGAVAQDDASPLGPCESDLRVVEAEVRELKDALTSVVHSGEAGGQSGLPATLDGPSILARLAALEDGSQRANLEIGRMLAQLEALRAEVASFRPLRLEQAATSHMRGAADKPAAMLSSGSAALVQGGTPAAPAFGNPDTHGRSPCLAYRHAGPVLQSAHEVVVPAHGIQVINHTHGLPLPQSRVLQEKFADGPAQHHVTRSLSPTGLDALNNMLPCADPRGRPMSPPHAAPSGGTRVAADWSQGAAPPQHGHPVAHAWPLPVRSPRARGAYVVREPCQQPHLTPPCHVSWQTALFPAP